MVNALVQVSETSESPAFLNIRLRDDKWDEVRSSITAKCLLYNVDGYFVQWQASDGEKSDTGKSAPRRRHV